MEDCLGVPDCLQVGKGTVGKRPGERVQLGIFKVRKRLICQYVVQEVWPYRIVLPLV